MADIVVKAGLIQDLAGTLGAVEHLTPSATPKGRYALSKACDAALPAAQRYTKERTALLEKHAKKEANGAAVKQPVGNGGFQYDLGQGFGATTPEYDAELATINDEDITLSGCRMITHAELGSCPITAFQERILVKAGLLEDKEPE